MSIWLTVSFWLLGHWGCVTHRSYRTAKTQQQNKKKSFEKRSGSLLDAARRLLDAGRVYDAQKKLREIADDSASPVRNRARACWLILQTNKVRDPQAYWDLLERFPTTVAAEDALREAIRLERGSPKTLVWKLVAFYKKYPHTLSAELALLEAAHLASSIPALAWQDYALHLLAFLARYHPESPHRDAALYRAARLCHAQGRWADAIYFLKQLLQTKETSFWFGDYNSEWLDDAQLLLGDVYLAQDKKKKAIKAWSALPRRFPHSRLRDRAWVRLMRVHENLGNHTHACLAARTLLEQIPKSRFAPEAAVFLARCQQFP